MPCLGLLTLLALATAVAEEPEGDGLRYRRAADSSSTPAPPTRSPERTGPAPETETPPPSRVAEHELDPNPPELADEAPLWLDILLPEDNLAGKGLLTLADPFPLAQLHLQLPVQTLLVLDEGEALVETRVNWANTYAFLPDDDLLIDAETVEAQLGFWYGLTEDFAIGAEISVLARGDGVLDPVVDGFHDLFGLGTANRELRPRNAYEIRIVDEGREIELDSGVGFGDVVLKAHWTVNRGNRWLPAVAIQSYVSLPTSTQGFGSHGVDLGMSLTLTKRVLGILTLYGVLGGSYFSEPDIEDLRFERIGYQGTFGFEVELLDDLSAVFQFTRYSALLEGPTPLDRARNYVAGGLKWEIVDGLVVEATLLENTAPFDNSADIALQIGFAFRL